MEEEYTGYVVVMWNNDSDYKGQTQVIEELEEAESIFKEFIDDYDNIELKELHTVAKILKCKV